MKIQVKKFNLPTAPNTDESRGDNVKTGDVLVMYADGFKDGHTVIRDPVNRYDDYGNLDNIRAEYLSKFKQKTDVDDVYLTIKDVNKTV